MTKSLFKRIISKPFSSKQFLGVSECSICLEDFKEIDSMITPLPCANTKLHIFHTDCIKAWLSKENKCPLCKEYITVYNCNELKENFANRYPEDDC